MQDTFELQNLCSQQVNARLCVDGAKRGDLSSAAGVTLLLYKPNGDRVLALRAGQLLGNLKSALDAELMALEFGLELFSKIVCMKAQ